MSEIISVAIPKAALTIHKGMTKRFYVIITDELDQPLDLTGCTAEMQIRETADVASGEPLIKLSTALNTIVITPTTGRLDIHVPHFLSSAVFIGIKRGVFDIELYWPNNEITRVLEGPVTFTEEVTRQVVV